MGDTNTFIPEGIYALANPSSGITALNMNCECNLFGRKTPSRSRTGKGLLVGILKCECGSNMTYSSSSNWLDHKRTKKGEPFPKKKPIANKVGIAFFAREAD